MGRYALLIGNSEYQDSRLHQLALPEADVSGLRDIFTDPSIGAFDDVKTLINPHWYEVRPAITRFFRNRERDDFLVLFFAGHGVKDRDGHLYITFEDTDPDDLEGTAIPDSFVAGQMDRSRAESQLLILDCCYSGAFGRDARGGLGTPVGIRETYTNVFEGMYGAGKMILTATDAIQFAWEGNEVWGVANNSLFTHALLQGIREGLADLDGNGVITVDELYQYIRRTVHATNPNQEPQLLTRSSKHWGHLVIARNPRGSEGEYSFSVDEPEQSAKQILQPAVVVKNQVEILDILPGPFEWCEIPQGMVETGTDIVLTFQVQAFLMAKYPITYAQFQVFLEAKDGFANNEWWQGLAVRHPQPGEQKWPEQNHPREHVSWYDAVAYCRWLSAQLGYEVRLPLEWEWEWAARGDTRMNYPWGDTFDSTKCNTEESGIGKTTLVDAYPDGASPFGVLDMSGNVWERCVNSFADLHLVSVSGQMLRGLRGGSWRYTQKYAQANYRHRCQPEKRYDDGGFRIVTGRR